MTADARFVVTGTPIPYARARTVALPNGSTRYFTDKRSKKYRQRVAGAAHNAARWVREGAKLVRRSPPWADESKCRKVMARATRRRGQKLPACECPWCSTEYRLKLNIILPNKRTRDLDNIEKNILDACTGVLWWDDRQAFVESKERSFSKANPRIEIEVRIVIHQTELGLSEEENPFPGEGWETMRAREWLNWAALHSADERTHEEVAGNLAALLRDCWASGFLEGMDQGDLTEPPPEPQPGDAARLDQRMFRPSHLKLVPPEN
jgi:Holliday junction resolvase RusA-like endonuclease